MVSGPSVYRLVLLRIIAVFVALLWVLATIACALVLHAQWAEGGALLRVMSGTMIVLVIAVVALYVLVPVQIRREAAAGYTTMINGDVALALRDPSDGHVLRAAGQRFPKAQVTLEEARAYAEGRGPRS